MFELRENFHRRRCVFVYPPVVDLTDRNGVEVIPPKTPIFFRKDQARFFEYPEMLHHGATVEVFEFRADVAGGFRFISQKIKYLAASPVGERLINKIVLFCP